MFYATDMSDTNVVNVIRVKANATLTVLRTVTDSDSRASPSVEPREIITRCGRQVHDDAEIDHCH